MLVENLWNVGSEFTAVVLSFSFKYQVAAFCVPNSSSCPSPPHGWERTVPCLSSISGGCETLASLSKAVYSSSDRSRVSLLQLLSSSCLLHGPSEILCCMYASGLATSVQGLSKVTVHQEWSHCGSCCWFYCCKAEPHFTAVYQRSSVHKSLAWLGTVWPVNLSLSCCGDVLCQPITYPVVMSRVSLSPVLLWWCPVSAYYLSCCGDVLSQPITCPVVVMSWVSLSPVLLWRCPVSAYHLSCCGDVLCQPITVLLWWCPESAYHLSCCGDALFQSITHVFLRWCSCGGRHLEIQQLQHRIVLWQVSIINHYNRRWRVSIINHYNRWWQVSIINHYNRRWWVSITNHYNRQWWLSIINHYSRW